MKHIIEVDTALYIEILGALVFREVYIEKHDLPQSDGELERIRKAKMAVRDAKMKP